jgi:TPR repeat protein
MVLLNLGYAYARGSGVVQDWAKAVHFHRLAAEG